MKKIVVLFLLCATTALSANDWSIWFPSSHVDVQWRWLREGGTCYAQLYDKGTDAQSLIEAIATYRDDDGARVRSSTADLPNGAYDEKNTRSWQIGPRNCQKVLSVTEVKVRRSGQE
jgi:hypothetical protein